MAVRSCHDPTCWFPGDTSTTAVVFRNLVRGDINDNAAIVYDLSAHQMKPSSKKRASSGDNGSGGGSEKGGPARGDAAPLMFIVRDASNFNQSRTDARAVASHVSSRYRGWRKTNRKQLALDATTQAILGPKRRKLDGPSFESRAATADPHSASRVPVESLSDAVSSDPSPVWTPQGPPTPTDATDVSMIGPVLPVDPVTGDESDEDYRQLTSRLGLLAPTAESSTGAASFAWRLFEDFVTPQPSLMGHHSLDPFSSFGTEMDLEMKSNLHFYFKVIRPFAHHLIQAWPWLDNVSEVQSSKVLAYAIASFASVFLSGCLRGGPGVVLPPPNESGQSSLWAIPPWLRLQTTCLSELNQILQTTEKVDAACYQAMLFLFRISVLLADGPSARIHARAMGRIGSFVGMDKVKLNTELSVAKVNIISAFLHDESAVVLNYRPNHTVKQLSHVVELDRSLWPSDKVWHAHRGMMAGRVLAWRDGEPQEPLLERTASALIRMDPNIEALGTEAFVEMQRCAQVAQFLHVQLNGINFNTSLPRVRRSVEVLIEKLGHLDLHSAAAICPHTLFNVLLAGAIASRGRIERYWYVGVLSELFPNIIFMDDVMESVAWFIDVFTLITKVLEETWTEVLNMRAQSSPDGRCILWRKDLPYKRDALRPFSRSPNLARPRPVFETWKEATEVEAEFDGGLE
jgi:hypothetical protein